MKRGMKKLVNSFKSPSGRFVVKIYISHDIFTGHRFYDFLLNPANEALVGAKLPYFPRGGPVPTSTNADKNAFKSSKWGGMDVGDDMLYPVQVVDGMVHEQCGPALLHFLKSLPEEPPFEDDAGQRIRCPVGTSVISPSFGSLKPYFGSILHTVSPFYRDPKWESKLLNCYFSSFQMAYKSLRGQKEITIASVLVGSGARGIPVEEAARVAATACRLFSREMSTSTCNDHKSENSGDITNVGTVCFSSASSLLLDFLLREEHDCEVLAKYLQDDPDLTFDQRHLSKDDDIAQ